MRIFKRLPLVPAALAVCTLLGEGQQGWQQVPRVYQTRTAKSSSPNCAGR
jgi:hypothetical protein